MSISFDAAAKELEFSAEIENVIYSKLESLAGDVHHTACSSFGQNGREVQKGSSASLEVLKASIRDFQQGKNLAPSSLSNDEIQQMICQVIVHSPEKITSAISQTTREMVDQKSSTGKAVLLELARCDAKKRPLVALQQIGNGGFNLADPVEKELVVEILKEAIKNIKSDDFSKLEMMKRSGNKPPSLNQLLFEALTIQTLIKEKSALLDSEVIKKLCIWGDIVLPKKAFNPKNKPLIREWIKIVVSLPNHSIFETISKLKMDARGKEDKEVLFHVFNQFASQDPVGAIGAAFSTYQLRPLDPEAKVLLLSALKQAAQVNAEFVCLNVGKVLSGNDSADQKELLEIARLAARQNGRITCEHIKNFRLKDQAAAIEIFKDVAKREGGIVEHIKNLKLDRKEISSKAVVAELIHLSIQKNALEAADYMADQQYDYDRLLKKELMLTKKESDNLCVTIFEACVQQGQTEDFPFHLLNTIKHSAESKGRLLSAAKQIASQGGFYYLPRIKALEADELIHLLFFSLMRHPVQAGERAFLDDYLRVFYSESFYVDRHVYRNVLYGDFKCEKLASLLEMCVAGSDWSFLRAQFLELIGDDAFRLEGSFEKILEEIEKNGTPAQKCNSLVWLATSALLLKTDQRISEKILADQSLSQLFLSILNVRNPRLRYRLSVAVSEVMSDETKWETFKTHFPQDKKGSAAALGLLFLCQLPADDQLLKDGLKVMQSSSLKNASLRQRLFKTLDRVVNEQEFNQDDKAFLCKKILQNPKQLGFILNLVESVSDYKISCLKKEFLEASITPELSFCKVLEQSLQDSFMEIFPVNKVENFIERYMETIHQFRDNKALTHYLKGSIQKLGGTDREAIEEAFFTFVTEVLDGSFKSNRYDHQYNRHLEVLFSMSPALEDLWKKGSKKDIEELVLAGTEQKSSIDYASNLKKAFLQKHETNPELGLLQDFLNADDSATREAIREKVRGELANSIKNKNPIFAFISKAIQLATLKDPKRAEQLLSEMGKAAFLSDQLKKDIQDWKGSLKTAPKASTYEVIEGDDPYNLLICGSEVYNSCQTIYGGDCELNKCLLGYVANGQNRLISVHHPETGKIEARALIRLLLEEESGTAALFLERVYPSAADPMLEEAVYAMAKLKAAKMALPLYTGESDYPNAPFEEGEDVSLLSIGGRAPYDYKDTDGDGVSPNSEYTVDYPKLLLQ